MIDEKEIRQYYVSIYNTFLGSNVKNQSNVNPVDLADHVEIQLSYLLKRAENFIEQIKKDEETKTAE